MELEENPVSERGMEGKKLLCYFYMHRDAFVNFHANMQVKLMAAAGQLDLNDAAAVKAVYDNIDAAVNSINVSLVFKAK